MSCDEGCNYWLKLPPEITTMILQKVGVLQMLMSGKLVCTQWRNICYDPSTWSTIRVLGCSFDYYTRPAKDMIRWAIDLSCNTLFDLDLGDFISEQLLDYVVDRCTQIRRLRGVPREFIKGGVLKRVAEKLPLLEDLELVGDYGYLSLDAIESLGKYCPRLRLGSLRIVVYDHEEAMAVAKSIPQLRHIYFSCPYVPYVGLEALLDSCSHLESLVLDFRETYCSKIMGTFQMMKKKKPPVTSTGFQWADKLEYDPCTWNTIRIDRRMHTWRTYDGDIDLEQFEHVNDVIQWAVDKSCGGLVDVDLDQFMSDPNLLSYVVERCTKLRRLRGCVTSLDCAEKALRIAAPRLSFLENLELVYDYDTPSTETIETLSNYCPRLTSLEIPINNDEGAKTIATSFPQLRHFKPVDAYKLTDKGVEALLDGCPHLESLDLADCNHVRLNETIGIRCAQQIKYLQKPRDTRCWSYSCCGLIEYFTPYEYDILFEEAMRREEEEEAKKNEEKEEVEKEEAKEKEAEEEIVYVNYTIGSRQEYWSRRGKDKGRREFKTYYSRREVKRKEYWSKRGKDRGRREFKTYYSRREVKREFIHLNKMATKQFYFV